MTERHKNGGADRVEGQMDALEAKTDTQSEKTHYETVKKVTEYNQGECGHQVYKKNCIIKHIRQRVSMEELLINKWFIIKFTYDHIDILYSTYTLIKAFSHS